MKGGARDPTGVQVERRLSMLYDAHAKCSPSLTADGLVFNIANYYMLYVRGKHAGSVKLLSACTSRWPSYMEVSCQKCCYADASFFILL